MRVGDGSVKEATGAATWIPLTNPNGVPLPGAIVSTDPNGLSVLDGRATPNLPAFLGTDFDRPEDMEIKTLKNGRQLLFVATTTNHKVFTIDLRSNTVKLFASRDTKDMATGMPVGTPFANLDNLAIDADNDGMAESVGKWANLSTKGAESSGLYFDRFKPNVAYINVQHPDSGVDRTIMITAPCPKDGRRHHYDHDHRD